MQTSPPMWWLPGFLKSRWQGNLFTLQIHSSLLCRLFLVNVLISSIRKICKAWLPFAKALAELSQYPMRIYLPTDSFKSSLTRLPGGGVRLYNHSCLTLGLTNHPAVLRHGGSLVEAVSRPSFIIKFHRNSAWPKRFVSALFICFISDRVQLTYLRWSLSCTPHKDFQHGKCLELLHDKQMQKDNITYLLCPYNAWAFIPFMPLLSISYIHIFWQMSCNCCVWKKKNCYAFSKLFFKIFFNFPYDIFRSGLGKLRILSVFLIRSQLYNSVCQRLSCSC